MDPDATATNPGLSALASLRRFARPRADRERCELCDAEIGPDHAHLVEPSARRMICACPACAILFSGEGGTRFRSVPRRVRFLDDFKVSDAVWDGLQLPIDLAFFLRNASTGRVVAFYPSPAGATESLVEPETWGELAEANPIVFTFEPDVEALLVNRIGATREYYRVGVDECYKLVGVIRTHWRGLSGGAMVWGQIAGFFDGLKERSAHA